MPEPLSYQLVAPLDWCQLKTLLWVVLPERAGGAERWLHVSKRLAELVPASPPPSPDACRKVYERLAMRMPALKSISRATPLS